jgi:hypothetical protein
MKGTTGKAFDCTLIGVVAIAAIWFSALSVRAEAQSQGNNAIYYYTTTNPGVCCTDSLAFIDAKVIAANNGNPDLCATIYNIITSFYYTSYPSAGAVIDARGLTNLTCASGTSPWYNGTTYANIPSTILLPSGTIKITYPWVLPNNTRLIGQGEGVPTSTTAPITTIQASSSFSGNMIQLGSSACPSISGVPVCSGISVENLTLDGQGGSINGIVNQSSQDFSYVDHVSLYQIGRHYFALPVARRNSHEQGPTN